MTEVVESGIPGINTLRHRRGDMSAIDAHLNDMGTPVTFSAERTAPLLTVYLASGNEKADPDPVTILFATQTATDKFAAHLRDGGLPEVTDTPKQ